MVSTLAFRRDRFGAGGEVRRGQAPPGPAISGSETDSHLKRPAPGGVRRMFVGLKLTFGRQIVDYFLGLECFRPMSKISDV